MEIESDIVIIDDGESKKDTVDSTSCSLIRSSTAPLKKCFEAIMKGKKVILDLSTLKLIILNDLQISTSDLDSTLQQILPYMLVSYIKSWPGWSRSEDYKNGSLPLDEYFEKFHKYASFKLTYLIQKGYAKAIIELANDSPHKEMNQSLQKCVDTQCDQSDLQTNKSLSAFSVNIEGPPRLLNTLIFAAQQDDILVKMHTIKDWSADFNIQQLINWPFVEVEFTSSFLIFSRKMIPNYQRFLARTDDVIMGQKKDFIDGVRVDAEEYRTTYARNFLRSYLDGYMKYLKTTNLEPSKIWEISIIFSEFYRDIEELKTVCENGICDATAITFNIGGCRYVRNKKTASVGSSKNPNAPTVGFCEIITPKCTIQLSKNIYMEKVSNFKNSGTTALVSFFESTQKFLENQNQDLIDTIPSIMYSCNYCKKQYGGSFALNAVLKHYQDDHRMEHAIMCFDCKKQYNVTDLSKTRWFHSCECNPTTRNPITVNLFPNDGWSK